MISEENSDDEAYKLAVLPTISEIALSTPVPEEEVKEPTLRLEIIIPPIVIPLIVIIPPPEPVKEVITKKVMEPEPCKYCPPVKVLPKNLLIPFMEANSEIVKKSLLPFLLGHHT